ncbi:MAG: ECF transporter S component, partial [Eubacterium sp.]
FPMAVTYDDIIRECTGIQDDSSKDTEDDSENNRNIRDNGIYIKKTDKHHLFDVGKLIRIILMLSIPFTLILGDWILNNRKYYFISLLLLLEIIAIFFLSFENRKAQIREVVAIATMSAMAVAGRMAFFMLPNFKPVLAIVIISGIAFGAESGFMVGALSMLVSNIMFGQGPWTPWQMVAMGIIGFISGKVFAGKTGTRRKTDICIFGIVAAIIIYGGIMNPASVIMWQGKLNIKMVMAAYAAGIPFDIMHAIATFIFLWLGAMPLLDKLNRVKQKYGLMC